MSPTRRLAVLGLAVVVLVAGFVITRSADDSSSDKTPSSARTVVVTDAKPVGGVKTLTWHKGDTIDLTIKSDTADEVHFHGYDVHKDVAKGGSVRFRFKATIEGRFVVELEAHKQEVASVVVQP
jgi:FtsP/CotA-like multicopper oxidase with cupredoxin domain